MNLFQAEFAQHDAVNFTGTIHENYYALSADCLYIPDCSNDFDENANSVYQHFQKIIVPLVRHIFALSSVTQSVMCTLLCLIHCSLLYVLYECP